MLLYILLLCAFNILSSEFENSSKTISSLKMLAYKKIEEKPQESLKGARAETMLHHLSNGDFDEIIPNDFLLQAPQSHARAKQQLKLTDNHLFFPKFAGNFLINDRKWRPYFSLKVFREREFYVHNILTNRTTILADKVRYDMRNAYDICNNYCGFINKNNGEFVLHIKNLHDNAESTNSVSPAYDGGVLQFVNEGKTLCRGYRNILEFYDSATGQLIRKKNVVYKNNQENLEEIYDLQNNNLLLKTINYLAYHRIITHTEKNDYLDWNYYCLNTKNNQIVPLTVKATLDNCQKRICAISPNKDFALWHMYNQSNSIFILQSLTNTAEFTEIPCDDVGPVMSYFIDNTNIAIIQYPHNFDFGSTHYPIKSYCLNVEKLTTSNLIISGTIKPENLIPFMPSTFNHYENLEFISLKEQKMKAFIHQINERIFKPDDYMPTQEEESARLNTMLALGHQKRFFNKK